MPSPSLAQIRSGKQAALDEAARYDALAAKSRAKAADYEAAERVWFALGGDEADESAGSSEESTPKAAPPRKKPAGIPPIPEIIIECLAGAANAGLPGLEPNQILEWVRSKYWPNAESTDVGSTAWRMWKGGRLVKDGAVYSLPSSSVQSIAPAPSVQAAREHDPFDELAKMVDSDFHRRTS
jgi:hypothetical protein